MIRQDQIGVRAGLIEKAAEAHDERDLVDRLPDFPGQRRSVDRIRTVDEQGFDGRLAGEYSSRQLVDRSWCLGPGFRCRRREWREEEAAGLSKGAREPV